MNEPLRRDNSSTGSTETPLVSVVVPTKNSEQYLDRCLESIRSQSYSNIELIVIDNSSTDSTLVIAQRYADVVLTAGPERSAQINIGARRASGEFIYRVDSDFVLDLTVITECMDLVKRGAEAVIVHNSPDVSVGFLSKIRCFEVNMYKYDLTHSSARFVRLSTFLELGGLDEDLTAGEDYDFQNRLTRAGVAVAFANAEALHLGEPRSWLALLRKYFWYGGEFRRFRNKNSIESQDQLAFFRSAYLRNWKQFLAHPVLGISFVFYHFAKFAAGGLGYLDSVLHKWRRHA
jgi:glycosyltransferase involved in cell wall biosynthesis